MLMTLFLIWSTEEMWEDEVFLQKVEKAGLLTNDEVLGKKFK